jgi:hypothetical protein
LALFSLSSSGGGSSEKAIERGGNAFYVCHIHYLQGVIYNVYDQKYDMVEWGDYDIAIWATGIRWHSYASLGLFELFDPAFWET